MNSRFTNLFKQTDPDEQRAFQTRALGILREEYPDKDFARPDDPLTIKCGESIFGLGNLRSKALETQNDAEIRQIVAEHFQKVFGGAAAADRDGLLWEQAKPRLMPQLMPAEFNSKLPLVSSDFGNGISLGFVLDTEESYSYVSHNDIEGWSVAESEVREAATENLKDRTRGMEMLTIPGDNAFAIVNTRDGFDAVRISLPGMRTFFAESIGSPFYFGIPNRDFLICWSANGDKEFQMQMRSQISADFDQQPYPLSRCAFEVTEENEIRLADDLGDDTYVVTASNN
ncbi:MAG: DUF1444 family protein [Pyrinomonadaceae bacterium]